MYPFSLNELSDKNDALKNLILKNKSNFPYINEINRKRSAVRKLAERQLRINESFIETINIIDSAQTDIDNNEVCCVDKIIHKLEKDSKNIAYFSLAVNLLLLILKIFASALSNSLSIISTAVDSAVDIISGGILSYTTYSMKRVNLMVNPQGKRRMEPIGIILISCIMSIASLQIFAESLKRIIYTSARIRINSMFSTIVIGGTIFVKLVLCIIAYRIPTPTARVCAKDHRNDILSNSFAFIGYFFSLHVCKYADPVFALLISLFTLYSWLLTGRKYTNIMIGVSATPEMIQRFIFVILSHDPLISNIDTVRAYSFGIKYLLEVDIVLPETMELKKAHDIGESLQNKLEMLPEVERAFVHLDYEYFHSSLIEHKYPR